MPSVPPTALAADARLHGHRWRAARPDELDDLVCRFDPALRLVSACAATVALFAKLGVPLEPGAAFADRTSAATQARWRPVFDRALLGETIVAAVDLEVDGRRAQYEVKVQPVRDAAGTVTGICAIARDVTRRAAAEERLREIEARHELLLGGTEDGVFDWEIDSGRVWFSPRALALYGFAADERSYHVDDWRERIHADDVAAVEAALEQHLVRGEPYRVLHRFRRGDDAWRWFEAQGRAARDERGAPTRMVGSFRDVTERIEADQELLLVHARMEQAFRMARVGAWTFTPSTGEIWWSRGTYLLFGRDPAEGPPTYEGFLAYLPPDDREPLMAAVDVALAGADRYEVQHGVERPDGERRHFAAMGMVTRSADGAVLQLAGTVIDVTEQHRTESALREAKELAERSSSAKSDFLASMSHELRTPLNAVIGFAQRLERLPVGSVLTDRDRLFVSRIASNGRHLLTVIDDILDIARIEAGRLEIEFGPVDVGTLCAEVVAQLEGAPRAAGTTLTLEVPEDLAPVVSDSVRLRQVLVNLVGNALKFTATGGTTVRVHADPVTHRPRAIDVVDTGIGIAADRLPHIFEKFEQAERGTHRRFGGAGLGLTICRALCEMMGHDLSVASVAGAGSTFTIRFADADG